MISCATTTEKDSRGSADRRAKQTELWRRYRKSSQGTPLEDNIVQHYLPLVRTVVGRLAMTLPSHVDIEDLYSAGLVGLLNAVRHFNQNSGTAFETYARLRIRGSVFDELRRMDWVPRSIHDKARKVQAALQECEQALGRMPTDAEVANHLQLSPKDYERWLEEIRPATFVCLDAAPGGDENDHGSHYEGLADTKQEDPVETASKRELARLIADRLEQLPEMQRKVLALYYFEDMRLREIAEAYGLTESRICQIHAQAITAIKAYIQRHDTMNA